MVAVNKEGINMSINIVFGWWFVPFIITVCAFIIAYIGVKILSKPRNIYTIYGDAVNGLIAFLWYIVALCISLTVWLLYFLIVAY